MLKIFRQNGDVEAAAAEAGEHLNLFLMENKKTPVLLMLSAGSSLSILEYVGPTALSENLTISMLDERFSADPAINNFSQLQKTDFYKDGFDAECSFFGTLPRPEDTMESLAKRWETNLKSWVAENPKGIIIATLGIGGDGHTAGMFPYPEDPKKFTKLFNSDDWIVAYEATGKHQYPQRITTTIPFFKKISLGFGFVVGKEKKDALDKLQLQDSNLAAFPALAWNEIKDVKVFTDIN